MNKGKEKNLKRARRHIKVRAKNSGTAERPRLNVFRSNKGMFLQLIDDTKGKTLVSAHTKELKAKATKVEQSLELGKIIAEKAKALKIVEIVFDRGGYKYHGRIEAVAEGARQGGLKF